MTNWHEKLTSQNALMQWGPETEKARNNFPASKHPISMRLLEAFLEVKAACAESNGELGFLNEDECNRILKACDDKRQCLEIFSRASLSPLQGGAGTSTNMMVNEVIGLLADVDPLEKVNLHQSTNDTYPTALRIASLRGFAELAESLSELQGTFQELEKTWAHIRICGRTEGELAVPMTLGSQFGSFSEAFARDRWRTFKASERLRTVNLGGTAIGTGITAPRAFIFLVIEKLRSRSGLGLSRAENTIEATANNDPLVEASSLTGTCACNLIKISNDLRTLHRDGLIRMEGLQSGSSIMPGKVNPVILESIIQCGMKVRNNDRLVGDCASSGSLQICEFMPLLADALLESLDLLIGHTKLLSNHLKLVHVDMDACAKQWQSSPQVITALLPELGYHQCEALYQEFLKNPSGGVENFLIDKIGQEKVILALSPQRLMALGHK
jgi:aspartate ammonia-lyase